MPVVFPKIQLKKSGNRSKSQRLTESLIDELEAGRLCPGDWLPSEKALAEAIGLARNTVRKSLAELERDGRLSRVPGRGTVVSTAVRADSQSRPDSGTKKGSGLFALVVPEVRGGFYPTLVSEFSKGAGELHSHASVFNSENCVLRQADIILQLLEANVAGVAIVPTTNPLTPAYQIRQLQARKIPVVFCHRGVEGVKAPLLRVPRHEVGLLAGRALVEKGHRRVAYLGSHRGVPFLQGYEGGLREALNTVGADLPEDMLSFGSSTKPDPAIDEPELRRRLVEFCKGDNRPTAIMASFDSLAEMIYMQLSSMGMRVPEDMSIVSFGGAWREGALGRRLTAVTVDEAATARTAIQMLSEMCSGQRPLDNDETVDVSLGFYQGETLGPPPSGATVGSVASKSKH